MNYTKINNIIKSQNKILIDYTDKIKNIDDFIKLQSEKLNNKKYNNFVFLLKTDNMPKLLKSVLSVCSKTQNKNFIYLFNKDDYLFLDASTDESINPNTIINFLNDNNMVCNICYDESENITICRQCAYNICYDCHSKLNNNLCPVCKFSIGSYIKI